MKSWLFALGLALCCVVQANGERFEDADHEAMAAVEWNVRAMVTNCPQLESMLPHMKATPVSFVVESPKKLKMTVDMAMPDGCKAMKVPIKEENGVFTTRCRKTGKKTVEEVEMNGNYMFTSITISGKGECKMATFSANHLGDLEGDLAKFRKFADEFDLADKDIHILSTEGMCPRSS
ncbi:uncharacterized protein M6D78_015672 isoform 2-T2 [Vipera latastei]